MSATYRPTIGLEVHTELKTKTKMFCNSRNNPEETRPNVNICPVCMAHPGTLPAINKEAVHHVLRVGTALGSKIADYTEFDRKSYFYPDIPKGYQISQYAYPLVSGGELNGVAITRVHLEEDTARSSHVNGVSLVDFNRAGVPLMELVTEPVMHDAKTAGEFARELQLLLRSLGVSDANLEKGEMRIEANVSVSKTDTPSVDYVEVKNINSFRAVERAITYEIERQSALLEKGERVVKATRGWNEDKGETFHQRFKEGSADYRYFPEPDLPKLILSEVPEFSRDVIAATLPMLPQQLRERYVTEFNFKETSAAFVASDSSRARFIDSVLALVTNKRQTELVENYFVTDLGGENRNATPESFAKLVRMIDENLLSSRGAKDVLLALADEGGEPEEIARNKGLMQVSDTGALKEIVRTVIDGNIAAVIEYKAGKEASLQFLIGQAMKASKGAGNPAMLRELLVSELTNQV